jgi:3-oxoacyl-[acyl-carrier protein] reductase
MRDYRDEYSGARVVITGACGIFGTWLAEAFAAAGARLLLTDARADELDLLAGRLGATAVAADLTDTDELAALTAAISDAWESPDVLVNCAGIYAAYLTSTSSRRSSFPGR